MPDYIGHLDSIWQPKKTNYFGLWQQCHNQSHLSHTGPTIAQAYFININMIQTRNSPPQPPEPLPSLPEITIKAQWSEADEIALIDYIANSKAKAGDGMKFKTSFWSDAKAMLAHSESGGTKTAAGCAAKWDWVSPNPLFCAIYQLRCLLPVKEVVQCRLYPQSQYIWIHME